MLSHQITLEEINSLCTTGKTPLIEDFVSNRTKKKFSASLVLDAKNGIAFEFAKRTPQKKDDKKDK
jgi:DNA topoisomerase-3